MKRAIDYLLARAAEPSTWLGLVTLIAGCTGWQLHGGEAADWANAVAALAAAIVVVMRDGGTINKLKLLPRFLRAADKTAELVEDVKTATAPAAADKRTEK